MNKIWPPPGPKGPPTYFTRFWAKKFKYAQKQKVKKVNYEQNMHTYGPEGATHILNYCQWPLRGRDGGIFGS